MAKALVFTRVRRALGFDHCHFFISGAGPLSPQTSEFFLSLDIRVCEMYGMSESSGPHNASDPDNYRILRYWLLDRPPQSPPATQGQGEEGGKVGGPLGLGGS